MSIYDKVIAVLTERGSAMRSGELAAALRTDSLTMARGLGQAVRYGRVVRIVGNGGSVSYDLPKVTRTVPEPSSVDPGGDPLVDQAEPADPDDDREFIAWRYTDGEVTICGARMLVDGSGIRLTADEARQVAALLTGPV